jgi:hypothetical protein
MAAGRASAKEHLSQRRYRDALPPSVGRQHRWCRAASVGCPPRPSGHVTLGCGSHYANYGRRRTRAFARTPAWRSHKEAERSTGEASDFSQLPDRPRLLLNFPDSDRRELAASPNTHLTGLSRDGMAFRFSGGSAQDGTTRRETGGGSNGLLRAKPRRPSVGGVPISGLGAATAAIRPDAALFLLPPKWRAG